MLREDQVRRLLVRMVAWPQLQILGRSQDHGSSQRCGFERVTGMRKDFVWLLLRFEVVTLRGWSATLFLWLLGAPHLFSLKVLIKKVESLFVRAGASHDGEHPLSRLVMGCFSN